MALLIEVVRDAGRAGDFVGYINAGHLALNIQNIYSDPLNTWPPLFSVFSIPLALMDGISRFPNISIHELLEICELFTHENVHLTIQKK